MKGLIEKISSYNIYNNLFTGIIFAVIAKEVTNYSLFNSFSWEFIVLYYFIGLSIGRFGSLIIEPILKGLKLVKYEKYEDFIEAEKKDKKIGILLESNNMYRTFIGVFISLLALILFEQIELSISGMQDYSQFLFLFILIIIFLLSYRKQTNYISRRIKHWRKEE